MISKERASIFVFLWHGNTPFNDDLFFIYRISCYPVYVDWTRHFGCTIQGETNKYQTLASVNMNIPYRGDNQKYLKNLFF